MPRFRVTIAVADRSSMYDVARRLRVDFFDHGTRETDSGGYLVDALADTEKIRALELAGYQVEVHEDVDEAARMRQREVGQGNRYERR